jgi:hypothetical protein
MADTGLIIEVIPNGTVKRYACIELDGTVSNVIILGEGDRAAYETAAGKSVVEIPLNTSVEQGDRYADDAFQRMTKRAVSFRWRGEDIPLAEKSRMSELLQSSAITFPVLVTTVDGGTVSLPNTEALLSLAMAAAL